ncbi:MAG: hypothetical protein L7H00_03455 [Vulcanisaeta sp.]|nr:hypothetical protein [Vulcanisaeta sp.]MCG2892571.1 hypothetical protein [Vulcanisaeta sp.]MCG2894948.1 hypothetical protein [Vulcanisaeta sp.]
MGFEFKCGTGLGEFIMGRVRGGSEVIVASPWLSPEVAEELVELSKRARVTVITNDDVMDESHKKALKKLYTAALPEPLNLDPPLLRVSIPGLELLLALTFTLIDSSSLLSRITYTPTTH